MGASRPHYGLTPLVFPGPATARYCQGRQSSPRRGAAHLRAVAASSVLTLGTTLRRGRRLGPPGVLRPTPRSLGRCAKAPDGSLRTPTAGTPPPPSPAVRRKTPVQGRSWSTTSLSGMCTPGFLILYLPGTYVNTRPCVRTCLPSRIEA